METIKDLSKKIGISQSYLINMIRYTDKFYNSYYIKKVNNKKRQIDSPNFAVKAIQKWILRNIIEEYPISSRATGFVKGKGIKNNAMYHMMNKYILCLDIKDFFNTIKIKQVQNIFKKKFNDDLSFHLAKLCTYNGYLPQGAPTSPMISNIVFKFLDDQIVKLSNNKNINYSRYADDLTFSSNNSDRLTSIKKSIERLIEKNGFELNIKKTRIMKGRNRKLVTGIILNSGRMTTGRKRKKDVRAMIFNYIAKKDESINIKKLMGTINFIKDIEPDYIDKMIEYKRKIQNKWSTIGN